MHEQRLYLPAAWVAIRLELQDSQWRKVGDQVPAGVERADGLDNLVFIRFKLTQCQREDAVASHVARANGDIRVIVSQIGEFRFDIAEKNRLVGG